ncbi:hypothetical protein C427_2147 [Paraglaciecola psychrophila 170]|uniref:Uncharacterized protein n=1 Tax=Paraglaciecola psychrophila 170 TaxID=1129794 RepID=K6Z5L6_9ALTE|nr:hypothetical protein C427_2147 [Paraglaciecola psychrophila 170]GAC40354.1 hypothetical protein GPSY_4752 [Paraglaciecola psychrophila 170]
MQKSRVSNAQCIQAVLDKASNISAGFLTIFSQHITDLRRL